MAQGGAVGVLLVLLGASVAVGCSGDDSGSSEEVVATTAPAEAVLPGTPPEVAESAADWPTAGQDYFNTRAAASSAITSSNVDSLEEAWRAELPDAGALSTVPLVVGENVYLQGGTGSVVAVEREGGDVVWDTGPGGFNIGPFGVAVGDGRVYALAGSIGVQALDLATGEHVWDTRLTPNDTTGIDIQPVVADGLVIASTVPISVAGIYAPGDRGVVSALDAATGEVVWEFDTVQGDLWGNPEVNSGGGAWYPPVIDLERELVYVGVANPAPFPGTEEFPNGSSRPGDNLYTNSIVALGLHSGELAWYHQVTPHDLFDRDQVHTLMAEVDGEDVIVSAGKSGVLVGLDPDDGTVLWEAEVGVHDNDDLTELDGPTFINPGTYGGVLTPPAKADGVVYAATVDAATELSPDQTAYFGAPLGTEDGEVSAVDAGTGELLWETDVPGDPLGGTAVVNDLVFTALMDGTVLALDRESGEIVWDLAADGGINGWMSVVGDDLYVPVGNAEVPHLLALRLS